MTREEYAGVVYDLDGTLVRLRVDWPATEREVRQIHRSAGHDPEGRTVWDLLPNSVEDPDLAARVEAAIAAHERAGAREAERLPTADELPGLGVPAGVCSLNCEEACRIALDRHDLDGYVDAVVGRDTTERHKPDPQPLLETIDRLGLAPGEVVFVGDSERDEECARRADVDFEYVGDGPSGH